VKIIACLAIQKRYKSQLSCSGATEIAGLDIGLAGVDNDGRPTDWRNLACYRRCGSATVERKSKSNHLIHITDVNDRKITNIIMTKMTRNIEIASK